MRTFSAHLRTMIALLALSVFLLAGCANPAPPDDPQDPADNPSQEEPQKPEEPEPPEEKPFDPDTFMTEIIPAVECLNSCAREMFGAEVDYDTIYHAGFDADGAPHLYLDGEPLPEGCEEDGTYSDYFPVANFSSLAEVRDSLSVYLSDEVMLTDPCREEMLDRNFLEYEGALYLWRGSRGYGAITMDLDTLTYVGEADGLQQAKVVYVHLDDSPIFESVLSVQNVDGVWKIVHVENDYSE